MIARLFGPELPWVCPWCHWRHRRRLRLGADKVIVCGICGHKVRVVRTVVGTSAQPLDDEGVAIPYRLHAPSMPWGRWS